MSSTPNKPDDEGIDPILKALFGKDITILPANPILAARGLVITGPSPYLKPEPFPTRNYRLENLILTVGRIQDGSRERKDVLEFYMELAYLGYSTTDEVVEAMDDDVILGHLPHRAVNFGAPGCNIVLPIFQAAIRWLNRHTGK